MSLSHCQHHTLLAYLGAVPFVGLLLPAVSIYALMIAIFMAGSH